jgi:enoyl-CoA hydratase/carnithine racemase
MADYEHWQLTEEGHIATLTLDRPDADNSLTTETLYELRDITAYVQHQSSVWAVILQGQGKHFSTGIDVNMIRSRLDQTVEDNRVFLQALQQCLDDFEALEKPTIAKLQGFCIGGGLILAMCCDFRIASRRTVFSLPEVRIGMGVIMGTQRVTRVAGVAATKEMILLAKRFKAEAAFAYGLLHAVVPQDKLDAEVAKLAAKFQTLPPRAVGVAKRIVNQAQDLSLRESQDLEITAQAELLGSPDWQEAIDSYLEKRRPQFTGE